ncbi:hypothetical protein PCE1_003363 [Barthelona sp. PCE]
MSYNRDDIFNTSSSSIGSVVPSVDVTCLVSSLLSRSLSAPISQASDDDIDYENDEMYNYLGYDYEFDREPSTSLAQSTIINDMLSDDEDFFLASPIQPELSVNQPPSPLQLMESPPPGVSKHHSPKPQAFLKSPNKPPRSPQNRVNIGAPIISTSPTARIDFGSSPMAPGILLQNNNSPLDVPLNGNIVRHATSQKGMTYLQQTISQGSPETIASITQEIINSNAVHVLMADPHGNYIAQKLFRHTSEPLRVLMLQQVGTTLPQIACSTHGTRSIQAAIEYSQSFDSKDIIIQSLSTCLYELMTNQNAVHSVHKWLATWPMLCKPIFDVSLERSYDLAIDKHGCCVLQRVLNSSHTSAVIVIIHSLLEHFLGLTKHQYGNYVVQCVLKLDSVDLTEVHKLYVNNLVNLSYNKFSSNVVEKLFTNPNVSAVLRAAFVSEIANSNDLLRLVSHSFGNYVVQKAIDMAQGENATIFENRLRKHVTTLRETPGGNRIASKLDENLNGGSSYRAKRRR